MFAKEIINGCYENGAALLTRYKIFVSRSVRLYVHRFHRSDEDRELHDHPWGFVSFILAGGYTEVRPVAAIRAQLRAGASLDSLILRDADIERVSVPALRIVVRPPWWAHRIELRPGRSCTTVVLCAQKQRDWGFYTKFGWRPWHLFLAARDCA